MEKNKDTGFRTKMKKKMEMFSSRNGASERSFRDENMENKMDTDLITKMEKKMDTFSSRNWSNAKFSHNEKLEKKMDIRRFARYFSME